ncbi:MAG: Gfo/Idh/MocA family oxidoreductase, partial [Planctomycetota bacterium]
MSSKDTGKKNFGGGLNRRDFVQSVALAGAGLLLSRGARAAEGDPIRLAAIGLGRQGRECLMDAIIKYKLPVRYLAVCDIWDYNRESTWRMLKKNGHPDVKPYTDYQDMLDKEKDVEAVFIATPDWMHSEITCAALKAGKHVYCEKVMSNSIEKAKEMVLAARETKKLLQIGHQRYSNPRYLHSLKLVKEHHLLGRIMNGFGQWNRAARPDFGCPKGKEMPEEQLKKYGYANMMQFLNWRHFKKYGAGPIADLGAHQVGVFGWFLGTTPKGILASGGVDYYKDHELPDTVLAIMEYETPEGMARVFYQVLTTTSARGYWESLMGIDGTMNLSENPAACKIFSEGALAPKQVGDPHPWDKYVTQKLLLKGKEEAPPAPPPGAANDPNAALLEAYKSKPPTPWMLPVEPEEN